MTGTTRQRACARGDPQWLPTPAPHVANTLGYFNVPLFSGTALKFLMNGLSTPKRVNRAYESERASFAKGDVVNLRRPSSFNVYDAPIAVGSIDDVVPDSVQISLSNHKEVKMRITDKEMAYSTDQFIRQHLQPMAYALANKIDTDLLGLAYLVPHCQQITASGVSDGTALTIADKILRENKTPDDGVERRHYAASSAVWQKWINSSAFGQWTGGGSNGQATQETAVLGQKYGFNPYPSNNLLQVAAQTSPTMTTVTCANASKGATSVSLSGVALTGTLKAGMVIQIGTQASTAGQAYNAQLYSVTADVTASGNAATVSISPPLRAAVSGSPAVTQKVNAAAAAFTTELAFHTDAIALCMVPLPDRAMGADVQTATDDNSGISVRARLFYDGNASTHYFALDALYGVQMLNPDMAVRGVVV